MYQINDPLTLDTATLKDLEVLSSSTVNGPTLLRLLDRTSTRAGRDSLRRRLAAPQRLASEIVKLQAAHQELAANAAVFDSILRGSCVDDVERYLDSNWQTPNARGVITRLAQSVWNPPWYREYLVFADRGRRYVTALLDSANGLRRRLSACSSTLLREAADSLAALSDRPEIRRLEETAKKASRSARERFDDVARNLAKPVLRELIAEIGVIESWWSVGVAAAEHKWIYPVPSSRLHVRGLAIRFWARQE